MRQRWIGGVLLALMVELHAAHAQYLPMGPAPGPMPEPMPAGGGGCECVLVPGPMPAAIAPQGPTDCLGLPADLPNAFDQPCCCPCYWLNADYLLWWLSSPLAVPVVTTGNPADPVPGALGQPGTVVLFGGQDVNQSDPFSGVRARAGMALELFNLGLDAGGFVLENRAARFNANSTGLPMLARPFVNANIGVNATNLIAFPGLVAGNILASLESRFWGADANVVQTLDLAVVDAVFVGFRYLGLREQLTINDSRLVLPGGAGLFVFGGVPMAAGDRQFKTDRFKTYNEFFGGQLGFERGLNWGSFNLNVRGAVALGNCQQILDISGSTTLVPAAGAGATLPGGLLALPSNIGRYSVNHFAVAPEADIAVGYRISPQMNVSFGYNFIYLSSVMRPGNQLDTTLNTTQLPISPTFVAGAAAPPPTAPLTRSDFWAQGVNFTLSLAF